MSDRDPDVSGVVIASGNDQMDQEYHQRNVLGVALRQILFACELVGDDEHDPPPSEQHSLIDALMMVEALGGIARTALGVVFPGDPTGAKGLYDCPMHDGREPIMDHLEEDA